MANARDVRDVKIFVLYLLQNIGYPIDFYTLNETVMRDEYILYLDFAQAFAELQNAGLVIAAGKNDSGETLYTVSQKGIFVAKELKSDRYDSLLDGSLQSALRLLDFAKRQIEVSTERKTTENGACEVTLRLEEKGKTVFSLTLLVDSESRAIRMEKNFRADPEMTYRKYLALAERNEKLSQDV